MRLFQDKFSIYKKAGEPLYKTPKSVQECIEILKTAPDGIFEVAGNRYSNEVVFVGFPIWWYIAPKIINTFLESYDFSGKTIVTFATSGGSGMGSTNEKLAPSCSGAILLEGKMLNGVVTQAELKAWVESL